MIPLARPTSTDRLQGRLLNLAALFLALFSAALTLAPAARLRTWEVELRWDHWLGFALWLALFNLAHRQSAQRLPERDPYLLPAAALLSGWGLLTTWRLLPGFGLRQAAWLAVSLAVLIAGLRLPANLRFLRRYKYLWLTGGLLLTGLTLLLGTNPSGGGFPHLWLGCCGFYLQPSEPLKLLLIVYLSAYMADRLTVLPRVRLRPPEKTVRLAEGGDGQPPVVLALAQPPLLPLLAPTLVMTGLALALLIVQQDLGTASIFIFLYTAIVYVASGRMRLPVVGLAIVALAGVAGSLLFDVVRVRVDAWLNPWLDPSGRSYQIVQSLIAIANGGLIGRGPGLGNPGLVPVAHSDFIFSAIAEETGLMGALAVLVLAGLVASRGLRAALRALDPFRRYLAAGLAAYLTAQSILIIGGNLRLMPLTGVTLPFVSYGGSSLLTSFVSLLLLMQISNSSGEQRPAHLPSPRPYLALGGALLAGLGAAALLAGWWAFYRAPALVSRTDNLRRSIADAYVRRGAILDRRDRPINVTEGTPGSYGRRYNDPELGSVLGYNHPTYGQAGLEGSLDPTLRGLAGYPALTVWADHLLFGQPPPGLDIRLSLDLDLQRLADEWLGGRQGALVVLNAATGEILAMASHPSYDPNRLDEDWQRLVSDPSAPLLNRATLGLYAPGAALGPLLLAQAGGGPGLPAAPSGLSYPLEGSPLPTTLRCALTPASQTWGALVANGCPSAAAALGDFLGPQALLELYDRLGLFTTPQLRLPADRSDPLASIGDPAAAALGSGLGISPLQAALAAATLSNGGARPGPRLVTDERHPAAGWLAVAPLSEAVLVVPAGQAQAAAKQLAVPEQAFWQSLAVAPTGAAREQAPAGTPQASTWYLAGSLPGQGGEPFAIAVLLEEENPLLAMQIGQAVLLEAMRP